MQKDLPTEDQRNLPNNVQTQCQAVWDKKDAADIDAVKALLVDVGKQIDRGKQAQADLATKNKQLATVTEQKKKILEQQDTVRFELLDAIKKDPSCSGEKKPAICRQVQETIDQYKTTPETGIAPP